MVGYTCNLCDFFKQQIEWGPSYGRVGITLPAEIRSTSWHIDSSTFYSHTHLHVPYDDDITLLCHKIKGFMVYCRDVSHAFLTQKHNLVCSRWFPCPRSGCQQWGRGALLWPGEGCLPETCTVEFVTTNCHRQGIDALIGWPYPLTMFCHWVLFLLRSSEPSGLTTGSLRWHWAAFL